MVVGEDGFFLMMMMVVVVIIRVGTKEDFGVVGERISEEVDEGWVDDEGEGERKQEEHRERQEVARVSVQDAL